MKTLLFILALLFTGNMFSQNNFHIVNNSSMSSGNMENNTGEIFVVYNFGGINSNKEITKDSENLFVQEKSGVIVFPNPVEDILNYKVKDDFQFVGVKVYDYNQKLLFSSNENTSQIDLTGFPVGIYTIIFNENPDGGFKIIKR